MLCTTRYHGYQQPLSNQTTSCHQSNTPNGNKPMVAKGARRSYPSSSWQPRDALQSEISMIKSSQSCNYVTHKPNLVLSQASHGIHENNTKESPSGILAQSREKAITSRAESLRMWSDEIQSSSSFLRSLICSIWLKLQYIRLRKASASKISHVGQAKGLLRLAYEPLVICLPIYRHLSLSATSFLTQLQSSMQFEYDLKSL